MLNVINGTEAVVAEINKKEDITSEVVGEVVAEEPYDYCVLEYCMIYRDAEMARLSDQLNNSNRKFFKDKITKALELRLDFVNIVREYCLIIERGAGELSGGFEDYRIGRSVADANRYLLHNVKEKA